jgi:hypothetical protein
MPSSAVKASYNSVAAALTITLNSLAAGPNYATSSAFQISTDNPLDVILELGVTVGTVAGNKQIIIFIIGSRDGTNYDTANSGVTDTTHDTMMQVLGVMPCPNNSELVRRQFSVAAAFGGTPPPYFKIVVKNDSGAALSGSGNSCTTTEVWGTVG